MNIITKAHKIIEKAREKGIITRPDSCERCGNWCKPLAHHNNYNYPLDVVWLCSSCHKIIHNRYKGKYPFNWQPNIEQ
jgi:hypothetical protein